MLTLGYEEYGIYSRLRAIPILSYIFITVTQGGDWGALVSHCNEHTKDASRYSQTILDNSQDCQSLRPQAQQSMAHQYAVVSIPLHVFSDTSTSYLIVAPHHRFRALLLCYRTYFLSSLCFLTPIAKRLASHVQSGSAPLAVDILLYSPRNRRLSGMHWLTRQ